MNTMSARSPEVEHRATAPVLDLGLPASVRAGIAVQRNWDTRDRAPAISLLLPSRGRPQVLQRFLDSIAATASRPEQVEVVLYTDLDDAAAQDLAGARLNLTRLHGPRLNMSEFNTACAEQSSGRLLMLANDDVIAETPGWDEVLQGLLVRYADGIFLGWPRDGVMNERLATFPILSRRACVLMSAPFGTGYRRLFIDTHVTDVFLRLRVLGVQRLHYLGDVVFRHFHAPEQGGLRTELADDMEFLRQRQLRAWQAARLHAAVTGREPSIQAPAADAFVEPTGLWQALHLYTRALLFDTGLPWRKRLGYWAWFCGHFARIRAVPGVG